MKVNTDEKIIDEILTRGVGEFIDPKGVFREKLKTNPEKIVIKFGVDPTRPDIHLGHAVVLHKLRKLQDLGAKVIFLVGDITAQIGDPTGKSKVRPELSFMEIEKNMNTFLEQVGKILSTDEKVFAWTRNSNWFTSITDFGVSSGPDTIDNRLDLWKKYQKDIPSIQTYSLVNLLAVLRKISHGRLIERDMFQDRIKKGEPIFMHEMLYPVLQGIDSNVIANIYGFCDLEVGGTDQHFNMLVGREVMEMNNKEPQAVISFKLLVGLDGKEKMSKSLDNYIGITDEPSDMYGKVMSIPDSLIINYFELCTFTSISEIENIKKQLEDSSINPKGIKMNLARQIVSIYQGEKASIEAENNWEETFSKGSIPENVETIICKANEKLIDIFSENKVVSSKGEFRRLTETGSITHMDSGDKINNESLSISGTYKIGKKKFVKIKNQ